MTRHREQETSGTSSIHGGEGVRDRRDSMAENFKDIMYVLYYPQHREARLEFTPPKTSEKFGNISKLTFKDTGNIISRPNSTMIFSEKKTECEVNGSEIMCKPKED